ncbi:MAG: VanZ family protein [Actinobacteria bacterium]|nr:VanZ family protein [Actinomycetota bacterium]
MKSPTATFLSVTQTIDGYTVLAFLPFLVVAPTLGLVLSRRFSRAWSLVTLTIAAIGAIIAVTIGGRMLKLTSWGRGDLVLSWLFDRASWAHVLEVDRTWVLNAVLFMPAGCLLTLTTRRPWITLASLSIFSLVIEVVQRATRLGVADVSDLMANIVGAAAGMAIAVAMLRNAPTTATQADNDARDDTSDASA